MIGNILRLRKIVITFARFGFLVYLERIPAFRRFLPRRLKEEAQLPEGLRKALESLGPTFIKFGQILSTRVDIFPPEFIEELSKLQDSVNPVDFEKIRSTLRNELGENFSRIEFVEPQPIASASLAQVHKGKIDGKEVVFKVKRPGVEKQILQDLMVLSYIARILSRFRETAWVNPMEIYQEFKQFILRELNFSNEARTLKKMKQVFLHDEKIQVPEVLDEFTTRNLIVMEYVHGKKITQWEGEDRIIDILVDSWMKQIFEFGVFHADPHPGNLLVSKEGKLILLDFGLTGRLDSITREILASIVTAIVDMDTFHIYRTLYALGILSRDVPVLDFELELREIMDAFLSTPLEEIDVRSVFQRATTVFRRMQVRLPTNILLLGKSLVQLEGICRKIKPDFVLSVYLKPYLKRMYFRTFFPMKSGKELSRLLRDTKETIHSIPRIIHFIRTFLEGGNIPVSIEELKETINALEYAANTLAIGLIVAAIIVGSALIMRPPSRFEPFGLVGFFIAGIFGVWFLYRIIRFRRF